MTSPPRIGNKPWLTPDANTKLESLIEDGTAVLEFGCGGSTVWFDQQGARVLSVEHNLDYVDAVSRKVSDRTFLVHHPVPYAGICHVLKDRQFDVVLVDGRGRVACVKNAMPLVKPRGWMILDNANRPRYAAAHQALDAANWEETRTTCTDLTRNEVRNSPEQTWVTCFWRRPD